jgi:hypothetical protein
VTSSRAAGSAGDGVRREVVARRPVLGRFTTVLARRRASEKRHPKLVSFLTFPSSLVVRLGPFFFLFFVQGG